jgi:hypothetical protein
MGLIRKIAGAVGKRLVNFAYNEDRAIDSLTGKDPESTISADIGLHRSNPIDNAAAVVLDTIQTNHVENALSNAELLEQQETRED